MRVVIWLLSIFVVSLAAGLGPWLYPQLFPKTWRVSWGWGGSSSSLQSLQAGYCF
jgi:hypothetical protein